METNKSFMALTAEELMGQMTLREKIAQLFLQYYQGYEDMPDRLIDMNKQGEVGGFIFFSGTNVKDIHQLHAMTTRIQERAQENRLGIPFVLSIDQEGGQLAAIFRGNTLFPGNMSLGLTGDKRLAYEQGRHVGKELQYAGINLCFAPVLDVDYDVANGVSIVDNRRYSHLPEVVADMGEAYIKGLQDEAIAACGKHFPGMRITEVDTHFAVDKSPYSRERLEAVEILPFKRGIEAGLKAMMTHHGIFESFDATWPASLSKTVIDYLRQDLGFEGLVITDDLIMQAILKEYGEELPIKQALLAGSDLIISTCASAWFVDYVEACVVKGEIPVAGIEASCLRILKYKKEFFAKKIENYSDEVGRQLAIEIASKALYLFKGKKENFPVSTAGIGKLGIVFGNPARLVMSDATNLYDISMKTIMSDVIEALHEEKLNEEKLNEEKLEIKESIMPWHPTDEEVISLVDVGIISDVIIFTTVNAYRFEGQLKVLKSLREFCPHKRIIAIATRSPQDAPLLAKYADEVIITGGITENTFRALGNCLFGQTLFTDHSPISYLVSDQK